MGALALTLAALPAAAQTDPDAAKRGEYIVNAAGCVGCHTDVKNNGPLLGGGRELKTPFGVFFGTNITPDPASGIGRWTEADFIRALREGVRPDGSYYYPAFPFASFTKMTDADMRDLWAYLRTVPPAPKPNKPHELTFPFGYRFLMIAWRALNFSPGPFRPDPAKSPELNRGAYLTDALGHCGECHTPRNLTGGLVQSMYLAGNREGIEGARIPNISPHRETGIGGWSEGDLADLLAFGMKPDGDAVGGGMGEVVKESTSKLSPQDQKAMIAHLRSIPAIDNRVRGGP